MADTEVQYEFKPVKTVRGMEARTIAKWESQGWELVTQTPGRVQTAMTFRRPKSRWTKTHALIAGGLAAVVIVGAVIGGLVSGADEDPQAAGPTSQTSAAATPSEATSSTGQAPTTIPTPSASPAGPVTATNNPDFAALLEMDYCDPGIGDFAAAYSGQTIEFDGVITNLALRGDTSTRYDILIAPGTRSQRRLARSSSTRT